MSDQDKHKEEMDKMKQRYQNSTGMPVVNQEKPQQGKTEFAKDKQNKDKR